MIVKTRSWSFWFLSKANFLCSWIPLRFIIWVLQYLLLKQVFLGFYDFLSIFWFSFGSDKHSRFPMIFSLIDWFWIKNSKSLSKVSIVTLSTESLDNLKTSSFPHFWFPCFSVWMEIIINISSSLSSTVVVLKFNVARELNFNDASESWYDNVILVR